MFAPFSPSSSFSFIEVRINWSCWSMHARYFSISEGVSSFGCDTTIGYLLNVSVEKVRCWVLLLFGKSCYTERSVSYVTSERILPLSLIICYWRSLLSSESLFNLSSFSLSFDSYILLSYSIVVIFLERDSFYFLRRSYFFYKFFVDPSFFYWTSGVFEFACCSFNLLISLVLASNSFLSFWFSNSISLPSIEHGI